MTCEKQIKTFKQWQFSFPTEIVVEIRLKLSNKSLLKCRSVCKLWHSLISDPYFINSKYLSTSSSINNIKLIFSNEFRSNITICNISDALYDTSVSNKVVTIDKRLELSSDRAVTAASCNGLIFFYDEVKYEYMFIWNPTTRVCNRILLGFYFRTYGFGYDESTDDYKFLAVCKFEDERTGEYSLETRIYSVKTGMWNENIGDFPHCESRCHYGDGKYSNGAFHWVCDDYAMSSRQKIVSFHLETETYGQVLQPEYDNENSENRFHMSLGALREELCMLCYYFGRRSDIWVMKVYGVKESWTKLFSIPLMSDGGTIPRRNTPLFISNDGKILFKDCRRLYVYDSTNGSFYKIKKFKVHVKAYTFVESLVSPMPNPW